MTVEEWLGKDNTLGQDIWHKKYQYNNETFEEWLDRVSGGDSEVRQLIKEKKFLFGGRTLSNRGTGKKGSFSNCYSRGFVEDNLEDIMQANTDIAKTFKAQGGQGISLSKLRPKGCGINDGQFKSDGIVPFMEIYNRTTESISQGGSRKGALIMTLDIWHPQARDFITIKSEEGRIQKANLSLEIDDEFMEDVQKFYETGEKVTKHIVREYEGNKVEYEVVPIDLYKLMMEKAWDWGEPGCIFTEPFRNYNLMEFDDKYQIETCNPCFAGNMRLLTQDGYQKFENLSGKDVNIYNANGELVKSKVWCSGEKDTVKITLSDGQEIVCTPDHRFITLDNEEVLAKNLKGKALLPFNYVHRSDLDSTYVKLGFIQGDGELSNLFNRTPESVMVNIGVKDTDIRELFSNDRYDIPAGDKEDRAICLYGYNQLIFDKGFSLKILPKRTFPESYKKWSHKQKSAFLQGCYSANGCVIKSGKRVSYKTTCRKFAEELKSTLLNDFGISAYITTNKSHKTKFENGTYQCRESYDINIAKIEDRIKFAYEINFYQYYKKAQLSAIITIQGITVRSVRSHEKVKVYDFTEPNTHWGIVEGVVVHNCGEQPLPAMGACNLASINLSEFVKNPFTDNAFLDTETLVKAIKIAVRGLDDVLTDNLPNHPLLEQRELAEKYRNIGLGIMGMYDMLAKLGIKYGSPESITYMDSIMGLFFRSAVIGSAELAQVRGAFPAYNDKLLQSRIIRKHFSNQDLSTLGISQYGLRNCSLLSIAPTGSLGTMLNISTGCEPAFALSYKRKTESLNGDKETYYDVYTGVAKEYMEVTGSDKPSDLFITSGDIPWKDRIDMQSVLQKHVDTAISSTVNLPHDITQEEIEKLYLYAWSKHLKGITIFRDGCKRMGILTTDESSKVEDETPSYTMEDLPRGYILKTVDDLPSFSRNITNGCGDFTIHLDFDEASGRPYQSWIDIGDGGCERNLQLISRLISLCLRGGIPLSEIIRQCKKVRPCPAYLRRTYKKEDTSKGSSCPSAIGSALEELQKQISDMGGYDYQPENEPAVHVNVKENTSKKVGKQSIVNRCPECGETVHFEGGCVSCTNCGWSKCE